MARPLFPWPGPVGDPSASARTPSSETPDLVAWAPSMRGTVAVAIACVAWLIAPSAQAQPMTVGDDEPGSPPDPLVRVIPIPRTDNRFGGDDPTEWRPRRTMQATTADLFVTGGAAGIAIAAAIIPPSSKHARGGVLFDEGARDFLRIGSPEGRYLVRDASDVGVSLASTWPFLVDALVTAWWHRGDVKLARNMALVSAEAFMLSAAAQGMTNTFAGRERPYGRLCGTDQLPENGVDCQGNVRYRSFFSGHSTLSFTSAGVLCVNHLGLGLLGGPWDAVTCVTGFGVATSTALFRVMSDMHYATDVTVGAIVGTSVGLLVPWLHLGPPPGTPEIERAGRIDVRVAPVGQGIGLTGTF